MEQFIDDFENTFRNIPDYDLYTTPFGQNGDMFEIQFETTNFEIRKDRLISYFELNFDKKRDNCIFLRERFLENFRKNIEAWNRNNGAPNFQYMYEELFPEPLQESPEIQELVVSLYNRLNQLEENFDLRVEETVLRVLKKLSE